MVRKTGNVGNAKRKGKQRDKKTLKQKDTKTTIGEFNFMFDDDEQLQDRYKATWEEYNKTLPNFPMPKKVSKIDARAFVYGKDNKNLATIEYVFTRTNDDKGDSKDAKHKNTIIEDITENLQQETIKKYINYVMKKFRRIEKSNPHKNGIVGILNANETRYNYVYYQDHPSQD